MSSSTVSIYNKLNINEPVYVRENPQAVHHTWSEKTFRYEGMTKTIYDHLVNRAEKYGGTKKAVYISFQDMKAYENLLLKGSLIMCTLFGREQNCCIEEIEKNKDNKITKLKVSIYNEAELVTSFIPTYAISEKDITSMLITDEGYTIQKLL